MARLQRPGKIRWRPFPSRDAIAIHPSRDAFTEGAVHINGIEGFRGMAEVRSAKFKGLPGPTLHLHLMNLNEDSTIAVPVRPKPLLRYLRENPLSQACSFSKIEPPHPDISQYLSPSARSKDMSPSQPRFSRVPEVGVRDRQLFRCGRSEHAETNPFSSFGRLSQAVDTPRLPRLTCGTFAGHARVVKDFARTVRDDSSIAMPLEDAVGPIAVADAITASVEIGQIEPVERPSIQCRRRISP